MTASRVMEHLTQISSSLVHSLQSSKAAFTDGKLKVFDPQRGEAILKTTDVADNVNASVHGVQCAATGPESAHLCLVLESEYSPHSYSVLSNNPIVPHTHSKSDARAENKNALKQKSLRLKSSLTLLALGLTVPFETFFIHNKGW